MKNNFNIRPTNWGLIARILFDSDVKQTTLQKGGVEELSSEEKAELEKSRSLGKKIDLYFSQKKYSETIAWEKIRKNITNNQTRTLPLQMFVRIAAIVVITFALGAFVYQYFQPKNTVVQNQIVTHDETLNQYELPDGTKVSLNSGSKLSFPTKFEGDTREVTIEGEAFFDVKPDPTKPFIINAGKAQIKVLGTSFNVNAYPGSDKVEVIVETGKVHVTHKQEVNVPATGELILDPGDKGTLLCANNVLLKSKNEDANFLAWKTHDLIFRETSLSDVIITLQKVYKTEIDIADEKIGDLRLTGHYKDYSIDFIMEVIASTFQVNVVKQADGKFIIRN